MGILDAIRRAVLCVDDDFYREGYEDGFTYQSEHEPNLDAVGLARVQCEVDQHNRAELGYTERQAGLYQAGLIDGYGEGTELDDEHFYKPPSETGDESFFSRVKRALW